MRNVLDLAAEFGVERLIYTSSFTTIGAPAEPDRLADERDFYIPGSADDPYYEAKWAMEVEALAAARAGLPVVVLCPVAVFGPGDVHMAVSQPLLMAAKGRMPFYLDASFSVVDVRDVAEAHLAAAERGRIGERYILSAHNLTLREGLTEIARVAGAQPPRLRIGGRLLDAVIAAGGLIPGSNVGYLRTMRLWRPVSNAKAVAELGRPTRPFAETIADALAWFRRRAVVAALPNVGVSVGILSGGPAGLWPGRSRRTPTRWGTGRILRLRSPKPAAPLRMLQYIWNYCSCSVLTFSVNDYTDLYHVLSR